MTAYKVSFTVEIPDEAPIDEVQKFIAFELGALGSLRLTSEILKRSDLASFIVSNVDVSA